MPRPSLGIEVVIGNPDKLGVYKHVHIYVYITNTCIIDDNQTIHLAMKSTHIK